MTILRNVVFALLLLAVNLVTAQTKVSPFDVDYTDDRQLLELLDCRAVRLELGIPWSEYKQLKDIHARASQELAKTLEALRKIPSGTYLSQSARESALLDEKEKVIDVVGSERFKRLQELGNYFEIEYYGLADAFAYRNFGKRLGVHQQQASALRRDIEELQRESDLNVFGIRRRTHAQIVASLNIEQQSKIANLMGDFFDFYGLNVVNRHDKFEDFNDENAMTVANGNIGTTVADLASVAQIEVFPEFNDSISSFAAVRWPSVETELQLDQEQINAYQRAFKRVTFEEMSAQKAVEQLDEILTAKQKIRLDQLMLYALVAAQGYSKALTDSRLSEALEIQDNQKPELLKAIKQAEVNRDKEVRIARAKLLEDSVKKLTPEQEQSARNQLGEFFVCPPYYHAGRKEVNRNRAANSRDSN